MHRFGATLRFLALAVCLVPFTSTQQARGALAPFLPIAPVSTGETPVAPTNEEEEEREERGEREEFVGKARHAIPYRTAVWVRELVAILPPAHAPQHQSHVTKPRTSPPSAADPFRNGLGTPYRC